MGKGNDRQSTENDYLAAALQLSEARVEYAKEWQWQRSKTNSDQSATQATIEKTGDRVTVAESLVKVLGWRLQHEEHN